MDRVTCLATLYDETVRYFFRRFVLETILGLETYEDPSRDRGCWAEELLVRPVSTTSDSMNTSAKARTYSRPRVSDSRTSSHQPTVGRINEVKHTTLLPAPTPPYFIVGAVKTRAWVDSRLGSTVSPNLRTYSDWP